ncbi:hypothetical protein GCM10027577_45880 [Spirosoma fluminis]
MCTIKYYIRHPEPHPVPPAEGVAVKAEDQAAKAVLVARAGAVPPT